MVTSVFQVQHNLIGGFIGSCGGGYRLGAHAQRVCFSGFRVFGEVLYFFLVYGAHGLVTFPWWERVLVLVFSYYFYQIVSFFLACIKNICNRCR